MDLRFDNTDKKRVELHCHTNMTRMAGLDSAGELLFAAWQQMNISALAITDMGSVQAYPETYSHSIGGDVKAIYGTEMIMRRERNDHGWNCPVPGNIILLARNDDGVRDIFRLLTEGFKRDNKYPAVIPEVIEKRRENILVGMSCESVRREILSAKDEAEGIQRITELIDFYDYIEIQPIENMLYDGFYNPVEWMDIIKKIMDMADAKGIPVVAVSNAFFLNPVDQVIYEALTLHDKGKPDRRPLYLRTTGEMMAAFSFLGEETMNRVVFENPRKIAEMCNVENPLTEDSFFLCMENENEKLKEICKKCACEIYGGYMPAPVKERLEQELGSVEERENATYYLMGHMIAKESMRKGYRTFARDKAAEPLVAFLCGMTNVNPFHEHFFCPDCRHFEFVPGDKDDLRTDGNDLKECCPKCGKKLKRDGFDIPGAGGFGFDGIPGFYERELRINCAEGTLAHIKPKLQETYGRENVLEATVCISTVSREEAISYLMDYEKQYGDPDSIDIKNEVCNKFEYGIGKMTEVKKGSAGGFLYYIMPEGTDIDRISPLESGRTVHLESWFIDGSFNAVDMFWLTALDKLHDLEILTGVGAADISFDDEKVLGVFNGDITFDEERKGALPSTVGIYDFEDDYVRSWLREKHPESFSDLVRINALKHSYFKHKKHEEVSGDFPVCFEDVYHHLTESGLSCSWAFEISEAVGKGHELKQGYVEVLKKHGVSDEYINVCNEISHLCHRSLCVENVMISWMMAFYKVFYPDSFYKVAYKYGKEYKDYDIVTDAVRRNPECVKKAVYLTDFLELLSEAENRGVVLEDLIREV